MQQLTVSDNQRFLTYQDGTPFFYLGDTAWELYHRLNREEADTYLHNRAERKYTVIQAVVLAEFDGLNTSNAYGHLPLHDNDPTQPNEAYFEHVDWITDRGAELDLWQGMLPTWGDKWNTKWGKGPVVFTPGNAAVYGEFLGRRYRDRPIIWIMGGDRPVESEEQRDIMNAMADGIKQGDGGAHLMTFHPSGRSSSSKFFHGDDWLDFNMFQSGHADRNFANYDMMSHDYNLQPTKPCLDGEPCYEDHPVMGGREPREPYHDEYSVRKPAYWGLFAGGFGHTYGCHDIWQMYDEQRPGINGVRTPWQQAILLPGATQMQHARDLLESKPFLTRIPDQSLIVGDTGTGAEHMQATRDEEGSYALVYIPTHQTVTVDLSKLSGDTLLASWFDPRTGDSRIVGEVTGREQRSFTSPEDGPDWVLVLDAV